MQELNEKRADKRKELHPYDVGLLKIEFGTPRCSPGKEDPAHPLPYLLTKYTPGDHPAGGLVDRKDLPKENNVIGILYHAGRHDTKPVAIDYMNLGHGSALDGNADWPETEISAKGSASMSAKGDHALPKWMNFYFPVKITTPKGLVLDLLLGQTGPADGFWMRLAHDIKAGYDAAKAGIEYYEGDEKEALKRTKAFVKDVGKIAQENHNLWWLTVKGTEDYPVHTVDKHFFLSTELDPRWHGKKRVKNSLVYTDPGSRSARFYYHSEDPPKTHSYYTFNLVLYGDATGGKPEEKPKEKPEEKDHVRMLLFDENRTLLRHDLDGTDKPIVESSEDIAPITFQYYRVPLRNVFTEGDVCCYFLGVYEGPPYTMVVCSIRGDWPEKSFTAWAKPAFHGPRVYFSTEVPVRDEIFRISCFDSSNHSSHSIATCGGTRDMGWGGGNGPTRLTIPPGSDDLYYLAAGRSSRGERTGYHLYRHDLVTDKTTVIQEPTSRDDWGVDDIQFVVRKGQIYFSMHQHLYRVPADQSERARRISDEKVAEREGGENRICASPDGAYIFFQGQFESSSCGPIFRVSTRGDQVVKIWPKDPNDHHGGQIQAVSDRFIFLDDPISGLGRSIDFDGNEYDLRQLSSSEINLVCSCDHCENIRNGLECHCEDCQEGLSPTCQKQTVPSRALWSHAVANVVVFEEQLFGTVTVKSIGQDGNPDKVSYNLVQGEIPKDATPETRIKFRFIREGHQVVSAPRKS
ncbi:MAG TPA: hypothetical protein VJZ76_10820 [Thermoanaerobaculia bacterium]|nr:hypothetical protein [Thermoanaerobaculia bacterium]